MSSPEVCVLKTDGVNCDQEMMYAFEVVDAMPDLVHINQLRGGEKKLSDYQILALPGGFSYGDDIASGRVLATELTSYLSDQMQEFVDQAKPIFGVCNGFQVLTRTGLLPSKNIGHQEVTLTDNESGRFECRWVELSVGQSACKFFDQKDFMEQPIPMQIAHGEGRFVGGESDIEDLIENKQVVFRYSTLDGVEPVRYPDNPNGSMYDIAGICDPSGLILGMMPHPERSITAFHPNRRRTDAAWGAAHFIFDSIVDYARAT